MSEIIKKILIKSLKILNENYRDFMKSFKENGKNLIKK